MIVNTYDELKFYVEMFRNGNVDLLVIESNGGYGKSRLVQDVMRDIPYVRIVAHATPLSIYISGYNHLNKPMVFDDVDSLLMDDNNIALLKQFAETTNVKNVAWFSTSEILTNNKIPQAYETKSRVMIICNSFAELSKKVQALKDRGFFIQFEPTNHEIINKIKEIIKEVYPEIPLEDKERVLALLEQYSNFSNLSLRSFVKGIMLLKECKYRNINWEEKLLSQLNINPKLIFLDKLLSEYETEKERLEKWCQYYSERSYYDYKKVLISKTHCSSAGVCGK